MRAILGKPTSRSKDEQLESVRSAINLMQNPHLAPCETIIHDLRAFRQHGVFRTTQVLHLEYGKLKRLAEAAAANRRLAAPPTAFLELMPPSANGPSECVIELEGPRGKMRIQWKGATGADLAGLSRVLWESA